jgi:hypothetical protein
VARQRSCSANRSIVIIIEDHAAPALARNQFARSCRSAANFLNSAAHDFSVLFLFQPPLLGALLPPQLKKFKNAPSAWIGRIDCTTAQV